MTKYKTKKEKDYCHGFFPFKCSKEDYLKRKSFIERNKIQKQDTFKIENKDKKDTEKRDVLSGSFEIEESRAVGDDALDNLTFVRGYYILNGKRYKFDRTFGGNDREKRKHINPYFKIDGDFSKEEKEEIEDLIDDKFNYLLEFD